MIDSPDAAQVAVVGFGDSLVSSDATQRMWIDQAGRSLHEHLRFGSTTASVAKQGAASLQILELIRNDDQLRRLVSSAQVVVFDAGFNDFLFSRGPYLDGTCGGEANQDCLERFVSEFISHWDAIVAEIRALAPHAVIETMDIYYPVIKFDSDRGAFDVLNAHLARMNQHIHESARKNGINVAEVHVAYNGDTGRDDPVAKGLILPDGVHPTDRGNEVIAEAFRQLEPRIPRPK